MADATGATRNPVIDIAKGIAILLVLVGHAIQFASGDSYRQEGLFYDNILFKTLYMFHMPLFMVISGYLFYSTVQKKPVKRIVLDRCRQLLLPIFTFAIVGWLFRFRPEYSFFDQIRNYLSVARFTLWFLWALLYSSLGVLVGNRLFKDNIWIWLVLIVVSFFTPDKWFSEMYKFLFPCFLFGYYAHKHDFVAVLKRHLPVVAIVSGVLYVACGFLYTTEVYVYISGCNVLRDGTFVPRQLGIDIFRIVAGLLGSVLFVSLLLLLYTAVQPDGKVSKALAHIGVCSMGIYCFQDYLFNYIGIGSLLPNRLLCFVAVFAVSYGLTLAVRRVKVLNLLFLGGR